MCGSSFISLRKSPGASATKVNERTETPISTRRPCARRRARYRMEGPGRLFFISLYLPAHVRTLIRLRAHLMKPHVQDPRSQAPRTRSTADTLRGAATVTHRLQQMPAGRRPLGAGGFEDLTAHLPRTAPQRVIPHIRPAVRIAYVIDQFPRGSHGFLLQEIL